MDVFISYKSEDWESANFVKSVLETNGITCWIAPNNIPGGSSYAAEIPKAIRECKVFVLILTQKAQLSKWVPRELDQAVNENKVIMPFMTENCILKDEFNFYLSNVQRYAAYENKSRALKKMTEEIKAIINSSADSESGNKSGSEVQNPSSEEVSKNEVHKRSSAPKKTKKQKKRKHSVNGKKIGALVICLALLIVTVSVGFSLYNTVNIAGEKFKRYDMFISLNEKTITEDDIDSLLKIKDLNNIRLVNCKFEGNTLSDIFSLDSVTSLTLDSCSLNDEDLALVELNGGSKLASLSLNGNEISDLEFLLPICNTLKYLYIDENNVSDITVLSKFDLIEISASGNNISNINSLGSNVNINILNLNDNNISELKALNSCTKITELNAARNEIRSLEGLENALELSVLDIAGNAVSDLNSIGNATLLTEVNINENQIEDISVLSKSKNTLKKVCLSYNNISDISAISGCAQLQIVTLDGNAVNNLDALEGLTELTVVSANSNLITDITGLRECKGIQYIDLSANLITDVSPLGEALSYNGLTLSVNLSNNKITEIDTLPNGTYAFLSLYGNKISDLTPLKDKNSDVYILEYSENFDYSVLNNNFNNYNFLNCPADKQKSLESALDRSQIDFIDAQAAEELAENQVPQSIKQ